MDDELKDDERFERTRIDTLFSHLCDADKETLIAMRFLRRSVTLGVNTQLDKLSEQERQRHEMAVDTAEIQFMQVRDLVQETIAPKLSDDQRCILEHDYLSVPFKD